MSKKIITISINNYSTIARQANAISSFNSIDMNQVTGDYAICNPSENSVNLYPQSTNSYITTNIIGDNKSISSLGTFGDLTAPLDARFDSARGKLWICDSGNDRIIRMDSFSLVTDFMIEDVIFPYSMAVNSNDGSIFIRGFIDGTNAVIYNYSYSGVLINKIDFIDRRYDEMPPINMMSFDFIRNRLWWAIEPTPYNSIILMWDLKNSQIVQLSINSETGRSLKPLSIDIDINSGNAIFSGLTSEQSYIFQIFRDNCHVVSTTYLPT